MKQAMVFAVIFVLSLNVQNGSAAIIRVPADQQTIQAGIDAAQNGDTVQVDQNSYNECIDFMGKAITVRGEPENPEFCTIDANQDGPVVTFDSGESAGAVLTGFYLNAGSGELGGGISIVGSSPTLEHLVISGNTANVGGGIGISSGSAPTLTDITLTNNMATINGGAIAIWRSTAVLRNVMIIGEMEHEEVPEMGGGIYITNGSADMDSVTLVACRGSMGAACSFWNSQVNMRHALIMGNMADNGASFYLNGGELRLDNSNLLFGLADPENASAIFSSGCNITMTNSIIIEDNDESTPLIIFHDGTVVVDYCDVLGGQEDVVDDEADLTWGEHNIDVDPMFTDMEESDYTLQDGSPCIDAGDPASPRDPDGSILDIGLLSFYQRDMALSTDVLEFPAVAVGSLDSLSIIISNVGGNELTLELPAFEPDEGAFYTNWLQADPRRIEPDGHYELVVYFSPLEITDYNATLLLISDDFHEDSVRVHLTGSTLAVGDQERLQPLSLQLSEAYPNPFNSTTTLNYALPVAGWITLNAYASDGRRATAIISGWQNAGSYRSTWSAEGLPAGVYLIRLETAEGIRTAKATLVR